MNSALGLGFSSALHNQLKPWWPIYRRYLSLPPAQEALLVLAAVSPHLGTCYHCQFWVPHLAPAGHCHTGEGSPLGSCLPLSSPFTLMGISATTS